MNKDEILDALEDAREKLIDATDGLSDEQMQEPGVVGDWSIKDMLYHISLWEAEMVRLLWQVSHGEKPSTVHMTGRSVDEINAQWYAQGKERPLERVLDDFAAVRKQTIRRVEALEDDALNDAQRYAWAKGRALWEWIAGDSFEHDDEHAGEIAAWRQRKGY